MFLHITLVLVLVRMAVIPCKHCKGVLVTQVPWLMWCWEHLLQRRMLSMPNFKGIFNRFFLFTTFLLEPSAQQRHLCNTLSTHFHHFARWSFSQVFLLSNPCSSRSTAKMDSGHHSQREVFLSWYFQAGFSVNMFGKGEWLAELLAPCNAAPATAGCLKVNERTGAQQSSCRYHVYAQLSDVPWTCPLLAGGSIEGMRKPMSVFSFHCRCFSCGIHPVVSHYLQLSVCRYLSLTPGGWVNLRLYWILNL